MTTELQRQAIHREYQRFKDALPDLVETLEGRWVVHMDGKVQGDHSTETEALDAAIAEFGLDAAYVVARVEKQAPTPMTAGVIFGVAPEALR